MITALVFSKVSVTVLVESSHSSGLEAYRGV
nr:MAG TPA: hypothetical protein [Microviridae sp.]